MIRDQILKDHFDMIYGWGKFGLDPQGNDLYNSPAYKKSLQEISLIPELEAAEKENDDLEKERKALFDSTTVEYAIKHGLPF